MKTIPKNLLLATLAFFLYVNVSFSKNVNLIEPIPQEIIDTLEVWINNGKEELALNYIDSLRVNNYKLYEENLELFLRYQGTSELNKKNYTDAFKLFFDALKLSQKKNNEIEIAKNSNKLGLVFLHFREPQLAIKMFKEADQLFKNLNKNKLSAKSRYLIAVSYKRVGEFNLSNTILMELVPFHIIEKDSSELAKVYNAIGVNYKNLKQVDKAVDFFDKAILIFQQQNKIVNLAKTYNNLANIYQIGGFWDLALLNNKKSIKIKESFRDTLGMAVGYINLSVIYKKKGEIKNAFKYGDKSIALMEQIGVNANNRRIGIYNLMSELHEQEGDYKEALNYARYEKELHEKSRVDEEATLIDLFEKKQDVKFYTISDSLLINQEILKGKNKVLTKEKSDVISISLIAVISLLLGIIIIVYWRYRSTNRIKEELEITNTELYATRISKDEKEVLLQEIHHRVKNNMQIISSLIRLQSGHIEDQSISGMFAETQNRIRAMAMVHELLYQTEDFEKLELEKYLKKLIDHLFQSYETETKIVKNINISEEKAAIDSIIPIGLIVNEAISNSLKYAFNGNEEGEISILFYSKKPDRYVLEISDNGIGENEKTKIEASSLGMELIESLVLQLDGTMVLNKSKGYHYTIEIPKI